MICLNFTNKKQSAVKFIEVTVFIFDCAMTSLLLSDISGNWSSRVNKRIIILDSAQPYSRRSSWPRPLPLARKCTCSMVVDVRVGRLKCYFVWIFHIYVDVFRVLHWATRRSSNTDSEWVMRCAKKPRTGFTCASRCLGGHQPHHAPAHRPRRPHTVWESCGRRHVLTVDEVL